MPRNFKSAILLLFTLIFLSCSALKEETNTEVPQQPTTVILGIDKEELAKSDEIQNDLSTIVDRVCIVLKSRLEKLNYSPCKVLRQEDNTIRLDLPKPLDSMSQKALLSTDVLEFYLVKNRFNSYSYRSLLESIDSVVKSSGDSSAISLSYHYNSESFPEKEKENITEILNRSTVKAFLKDSKFLWAKNPVVDNMGNPQERFNLFNVDATPAMTGDKVVKAKAVTNQQLGGFAVTIEFSSAGAREFATTTDRYKGKELAIVVGNRVYSAPGIREKIIGGSAWITGKFTKEEATNLAVILSCGKNLLPLKVLSTTKK